MLLSYSSSSHPQEGKKRRWHTTDITRVILIKMVYSIFGDRLSFEEVIGAPHNSKFQRLNWMHSNFQNALIKGWLYYSNTGFVVSPKRVQISQSVFSFLKKNFWILSAHSEGDTDSDFILGLTHSIRFLFSEIFNLTAHSDTLSDFTAIVSEINKSFLAVIIRKDSFLTYHLIKIKIQRAIK